MKYELGQLRDAVRETIIRAIGVQRLFPGNAIHSPDGTKGDPQDVRRRGRDCRRCSARTEQNVQHLIVKNSTTIHGDHPSDSATDFVDARKAWYVAWQLLPGATGLAMVPLAKRTDAEAFVMHFGGQLLGLE